MSKENIKLVCFDVDDTLIEQNSWERLNAALGVTPEEDQALYHQYKKGEITYAQWQEKLEVLYKERGLVTKERVNEVLTTFVFKPGAQELVQYLQTAGYEIALISGSFNLLVEAIAEELGVAHFVGCIETQVNGNALSLDRHCDKDTMKLAALESVCKKLAISLEECTCIADGANDRPMFTATGKGITFADSPVADVAWKTIASLDEVREIL